MIAAGGKTCRKTLSPRNWPVLLFVMVLFPITGVLSLSNAAYKVKIPLFVELVIEARPLFNTAFTIAYVIMILVCLRRTDLLCSLHRTERSSCWTKAFLKKCAL